MNNLAIKESIKVNGVIVPNISGGFGKEKKAMLAKHIAEIHGKQLKHVNETINSNRSRFKDNVDVIDVKNHKEFEVALTDHGAYTQNALNRSTNIYLLSERGYAKLIKLFNDDKSWDLYDIMLDEYFEMRDGNVVPMDNTPMTPAEMLMVYAQQFLEQEQRTTQLELAQKESQDKIVALETDFHKESTIEGYSTNDNVARGLHIFSASDKPHSQFIDAVAQQLKIYNNKIGYEDEYIKTVRQTSMGGIVTGVVYYSPKGVELIKEYVKSNFKPVESKYVRGDKKGEFKSSMFKLGSKNFSFSKETQDKYREEEK